MNAEADIKIVINGRFLTQKMTGVQRYATEIVSELDRIVPSKKMEIAIPPEVKELPQYKNIKVVRTGYFTNRLWEHLSFPLYVWRKKGVSLNLCNVAPLLSPGIVCIHDMKIKAKPQFFTKKALIWYNLLFKNAAIRAKTILTVSEFSKKEICKYYDVNSSKVYVIPSAWQHYARIANDETYMDKYQLKGKPYFFSISSLEPDKNFKWIAELAKCNEEYTFVVAGGVNRDVFSDGSVSDVPTNMKFLGYIEDRAAKTLMKNCKAFLFPTFYEGFGLPPLEAISAGAPAVLVSDTEVMHEIYGKNAVYIDPYDANIDLDKAISSHNIICMDELLKNFSWELSALKLRSILKI